MPTHVEESKKLSGQAVLLPHDVRSGMIVPILCRGTFNTDEFKEHCFDALDKKIRTKIAHNDIIVAGKDFAKGESGEESALALRGLGVSCVIAVSVNRIFLRNAINLGFPVVILPAALDMIEQGDILEVDPFEAIVRNVSKGLVAKGEILPKTFLRILKAGDIVNYINRKISNEDESPPVNQSPGSL
ncbi:MAG: hypothetical protein ABIG42_12075 [bacterium]